LTLNKDISVDVIIPCIDYDIYIDKTLSILTKSNLKTKIILISEDDKIIDKKILKNHVLKNVNISEKRNFGVSKSKSKYIAFIDSDAYPNEKWLNNAIQILETTGNDIGLITGPDIAPKKEMTFSQWIVGEAHKSFFLSGFNNFRKNAFKKNYLVRMASSCNMVMKRNVYNEIGGMNEKVYIGEDIDFCLRIRSKYKILYSHNTLIYHRPRNFLKFLFQRLIYGFGVFKLINFSNINLTKMYFGPFLFLIGSFLLLLLYFFSNNYLFILLLLSKYIIVFLETIKISKNKLYSPIIFIVVLSGIFSFAIGSMISFLNMNFKLKEIYRNRD